MTIPDEPLIFENFDVGELTWEEVELLTGMDPEEAKTNPGRYMRSMRGFLEAHSNWKREEILAIRMREMVEVSQAVAEAIRASAVPLANSPS